MGDRALKYSRRHNNAGTATRPRLCDQLDDLWAANPDPLWDAWCEACCTIAEQHLVTLAEQRAAEYRAKYEDWCESHRERGRHGHASADLREYRREEYECDPAERASAETDD